VQIARRQALDGGLRSDRAKGGRGDIAMRRVNHPDAGHGVGVPVQQIECHRPAAGGVGLGIWARHAAIIPYPRRGGAMRLESSVAVERAERERTGHLGHAHEGEEHQQHPDEHQPGDATAPSSGQYP